MDFSEAARTGRDLVLPIKEEENSEFQDFSLNTNDHMISLESSVYKEPIPRRSSEVTAISPNPSSKGSPIAPSPDFLEHNQSPAVPDEFKTPQGTQMIQDEIHPPRRFSVIGTGVPSHQVRY